MATPQLTPEVLLRFYEREIPEFIRKYLEAEGPQEEGLRTAYRQILQAMFRDCTTVMTTGSTPP